MRANRKPGSVIGLIAVFAWPFLFLGGNQKITDVHQDSVIIGAEWAATLVAGLIGFVWLRRGSAWYRIHSFGWRDALIMLVVLGATVALSGAAASLVNANPMSQSDLRHLAGVPLWFRLLLVSTAGICEEFLYRGFAIEEFGALTGNRWVAAAVSLIFFTLAHAGRYGWTAGLIVPGLIGAAISLLYLLRNNLPLCMLMHALVDGLAVVVVPQMVGHR